MLNSLLLHWRTAAGLIGLNIVAWAVCRVLFLRNSDSLWQDQVGLFQALLLLDTLLVVWWYTEATVALGRTAERQLAQAAVAERIRHKPFAVAVVVPLTNSGFEY